MMPASLLRKRTKTSPKYEQTGAPSFFIITKIPGSRARLRGFLIILLYCFSFYLRPAPLLPPLTDPRELELLEDELADVEDKDEYEADGVFFVPQEARWSVISMAAHTPEIGKIIDDALQAIERENP